MGTPHRQARRTLRPSLVFDAGDPLATAEIVRKRVADIRRQTGAGAYVLMDCELQVYILRAASTASWASLEQFDGWFVGNYCRVTAALEIAEDLVVRKREIGSPDKA